MALDTSIVVNHVEKKYKGKPVLQDISFSLQEGVLGILGENGAGKSTLLKILSTALKQDKGEVTICGSEPNGHAKDMQSGIGYLPQDFDFFRTQKLYEGMEYIAMLKGMEKPYQDHINKLLKIVNLYEHRDKRIGELSGGMRQRFGIAQSLLNRPSVIIMDEPTAGLDPGERIHFRNVVNALNWKCSVIISSHIVGDMELLCDKILLMRHGQMLYYGSQEQAISEMQDRVIVLRQDAKAPIKWGKNVVSVKKTENEVKIRMILDKRLKATGELSQNIMIVEPTLEDFYFYKMYVG